MVGVTIRCFTSVIVVSVLILSCLYLYIASFHRIKDFEDYVAISKTISAAKVSNRCRRIDDQNLQCLPNVLLIGASKCGTTSLVEYLSQHANIKFVNRRIHVEDKHKEVHRFDRNTYGFSIKALDLADEWTSSPLVASENTTVIHYTPHYLYAPTVPYEMKRFYPHADALKFIVILRDPIARAWSSYWFHNSHLLKGVDGGNYLHYTTLHYTTTPPTEYIQCFVPCTPTILYFYSCGLMHSLLCCAQVPLRSL